jgi:signal peptidase II
MWLALAGFVIALDQATKAWIVEAFGVGESLSVAPCFNIAFVFNSGASFSFLADAGGWQRWLFVGLALSISAWLLALLRQHSREKLLPVALAMILGGALGNVIDRFRYGAVVDFLDFHLLGAHFPTFNVADSAISVGVALTLWHQFTTKDSGRV